MSNWRALLDPELAADLDRLPVIDFDRYKEFRATSDAAGVQRAALVDTGGLVVEDRVVPAGGSTVRVRLYRPDVEDGERPAILHIHGGGFVSGSPNSSHAGLVHVARQLRVVVVSVDYRRAPEHPYPAPLDDCATALRWLVESAELLRVDRRRIAVHGISAGGALAAALAIRVRNEAELCFQFLSAPIIDDRLTTASMQRYDDTPIWNRPVGEASWRCYLGDLQAGSDDIPATAAPGRATIAQLRGLPPAYIAVTELDPLCDEGLDYGAKLAAAGVSVETHRFPGAFHAAFTTAPNAALSLRYAAEELDVLARALGVGRVAR